MEKKTILVINCGSSSLKFALFDLDNMVSIASGLAENLGSDTSRLKISTEKNAYKQSLGKSDHHQAIMAVKTELNKLGLLDSAPAAIGHRVVHGGEFFNRSTLINQHVIDQIHQCAALAPLHNPANSLGIRLMQQLYPGTPQIAVFDTAFHQTIPKHAFLYALPYELYENESIRRYGFHGTSHKFVASQAANRLNKPLRECNLITAHLGNGCSITAIKNGISVDTTMGFTPLEGVMMGTRCGDIDPSIVLFLLDKGWTSNAINNLLNKESGIKGISGKTNDMRTLCELADEGSERAQIALDMFCFRISKYIFAMAASLPSIDALVFTGGIGENSSFVRNNIVNQLSLLGFKIDTQRNETNGIDSGGAITTDPSRRALVIPTNEELMIASDTKAIVNRM